MDIVSLLWFTIAVFILGLSIIPLRIYVRDRDKRKLMYFLGLALSTVTFFILSFGYNNEYSPNSIIQVFYLWGGIVYLIFLFHMTLERLLSNKINITYLFYSFTFNMCISLIVLLSGIVTQEVFAFFMFISTIFIFAFCITLIAKYKDTIGILFLFSLITTFISSMMLSQVSNNIIAEYFSIYSYFISYALLGIIFLFSTRKTSSDVGIGSYFSLEQKLEETTKVLSETKDTFHTLFNEMIDAVVIVDDKGTLLEASNKFFDEINTPKDEIIGMNFLNTAFFDESTKKLLMENMVLRLEGKHIAPYEILLRKKDGSTLPYEIHAGKVQYKGKTADMVIFRNLTERKRTEEALNRSEKEKSLILNSTKELFIYYTTNLEIVWANNAASEAFGKRHSELKGVHCHSLFFSNDAPCNKCPLLQVLETGKPESQEIETSDGRFWFVRGYPVFDENHNIINLIEFALEITDRKIIEKQIQKAHEEIKDINRNLEQKVKERTEKINRLLRQKDEFIQQMGHDLKNPLGPLVTLLPLLKNACKDPKYCEMLDVILRNVNYMKNLVQKTLDLAQLSSPNTQLKFEKIDLKEQVDSVIKDNKLSLDQISAKVYNKVPEDIQIDADTLRLQEVLNNLISNAVKYRSHECLIEIDAVQTDTDIKVSVKDNGIGMNENQLSHVFTEFYKADPARHDFTSTGLGLSICKRIIEMHGGNIGVSSEGLNRGTTFFFTIPNRNSVTVNVPYQGTSHIIERISN